VDAIKGISLYLYNKDDNKLVKIGTSMRNMIDHELGCLIDENVVMVSCDNKVKMMRRNKHGDTESERLSFQIKATLNLNDTISCLQKESIKLFENYSLNSLSTDSVIPTISLDYIVYGTEKGSVGVIVILPEKTYLFLKDLQECILCEITNPNSFGSNYMSWRCSVDGLLNERNEPQGFIDGDILKRFITYSQKHMQEILDKMSSINKPPIADILLLIERLNKFI